jgi:hypothetical protein
MVTDCHSLYQMLRANYDRMVAPGTYGSMIISQFGPIAGDTNAAEDACLSGGSPTPPFPFLSAFH